MRTLLGMLCLVVSTGLAQAGDDLDRAAISAGVNKVKSAVTACESKATSGGMVKVKVTVAADGKVASATTDATDKALGECVVGVLRTATFSASKNGGSFSYPFLFGSALDASASPAPRLPPVDQVGRPPEPRSPVAAGLPENLDKQMIVDGVARIREKVLACSKKSKSGGLVKIRTTVKPDGKVGAATADGVVDAKLAACAVAAMKTAKFAKTQTGGMFSFPFKLHPGVSNAPAKNPLAGSQSIEFDRALIVAGITAVKNRISDCGVKFPTGGTVKVRVVVDPDGVVTKADLGSTAQSGPIEPSTDLEKCVVDTIKTATFASTMSGGSFSYPFSFGPAKNPSQTPLATGQGTPALPPASDENLDRVMISEGVAKAKTDISACASVAPTAKGAVKVKVVVMPSGSVSAAEIIATPDKALGDCVAGVLKKTAFRATKNGGSFSYPFVF